MSTEVSLATLSAIAGTLDKGSESIEGIGAAPTGVDAGVMTAFISSLLGTLTASAAGVSEGLTAAAAEVRAGATAYDETDGAAQSSLDSYRGLTR